MIVNVELYLRPVEINYCFVSIRSVEFPLNSVHPSGARFNRPGEFGYYLASGLPTALAERYGAPRAAIPSGDALFGTPRLEYDLFDMRQFVTDYPAASGDYFPTDGDRGYEKCRQLRQLLEATSCSGVIFPSQKCPGGANVALWPLGEKPLPEEFFVQLSAFVTEPFDE